MNGLRQVILETIGVSIENQNKLLITLMILILLSVFRLVVLRMVWRNSEEAKVRYQWKRMLSFIIPVVGLLMIGAVWASSFKQLGAYLGLLSAGIAIALKEPLTNIAGWVFILIRKPFVVGDRVELGNNKGDVIDIRFFQFTLLEIGNWVDADQSTGRILHIPNGRVFSETQANYSAGFEYIWNEIKVLVTFESDWAKAKVILEDIIKSYTLDNDIKAKQEIKEASKNYMIYYTHLTPIVYTSVKDSGIQLTIRYLCNPRRRRGTENEIWEAVLIQFEKEKRINLAYPTTRFYREGEDVAISK